MGDSFQQLDREIIDAHTCGDGRRLAQLYAYAARHFAAVGELDRAAFLFVNAYVWALDAGEDGVATQAREALMGLGREH